jgi:hypothetical protein
MACYDRRRRHAGVARVGCRYLHLVLVLFALAACPKSKTPVFGPPAFADGGSQSNTKAIGEDCSGGGPSDCQSQLCFHYLPGAQTGFVCGKKCSSDADCPVTWSCQTVYPAPGNDFCVPPKTWTPQVAQMRN